MSAFDLSHPSQEHKLLRDMVRSFAREELAPQALEFDRQEKFNLPLLRKLGALGLLGISVPEAFGGSEQDAVAVCIAHEELSAEDPGFCLAYLAHSLLCANNIARNASEEQKRKYLPKLCSGEWIGAMAISEPAAGTDVMAMETRALLVGEKYRVSGRKMWITNGTLDEQGTPCDVLWLYARSEAAGEKTKVSSFILEKSQISVGQKIKDKLGMRASSTAELVFDQVEIPRAALVGLEGESLQHMMKNLEVERLGLAAMALGIARRSLEIMNRYAQERQAFGKSINSFGQIQRHIAESYAEYRAARAYLYDTARSMDLNKEGQRLDSDGVKLFISTVAKNIADRAIQCLGGYGYVGEYNVERLWRDAKLLEIGGGTLEAHQKNMTRDLAKLGVSPELC
jgi:isovaleryl-CoA dehydrogenase